MVVVAFGNGFPLEVRAHTEGTSFDVEAEGHLTVYGPAPGFNKLGTYAAGHWKDARVVLDDGATPTEAAA